MNCWGLSLDSRVRNSWGLQFQRGAKLSCGFDLKEPHQILTFFKSQEKMFSQLWLEETQTWWTMPRVFSVSTIYLPRNASLPEPYSTGRKGVSATPASSLHPVSPQGTRARGGLGDGHSSGAQAPKRLEKAFPPKQLTSIHTGLQYSNRALQWEELQDTDSGSGYTKLFQDNRDDDRVLEDSEAIIQHSRTPSQIT